MATTSVRVIMREESARQYWHLSLTSSLTYPGPATRRLPRALSPPFSEPSCNSRLPSTARRLSSRCSAGIRSPHATLPTACRRTSQFAGGTARSCETSSAESRGRPCWGSWLCWTSSTWTSRTATHSGTRRRGIPPCASTPSTKVRWESFFEEAGLIMEWRFG